MNETPHYFFFVDTAERLCDSGAGTDENGDFKVAPVSAGPELLGALRRARHAEDAAPGVGSPDSFFFLTCVRKH